MFLVIGLVTKPLLIIFWSIILHDTNQEEIESGLWYPFTYKNKQYKTQLSIPEESCVFLKNYQGGDLQNYCPLNLGARLLDIDVMPSFISLVKQMLADASLSMKAPVLWSA